MARKVAHLLHDILEAIEHVEHATRGKTCLNSKQAGTIKE
jgi:hypothetical protein